MKKTIIKIGNLMYWIWVIIVIPLLICAYVGDILVLKIVINAGNWMEVFWIFGVRKLPIKILFDKFGDNRK